MRTFGRKEIQIPLSKNEVTKENIIKYLPNVFSVHLRNSNEYRYLHRVYRGKQDIYKKERTYTDANNNIIVENHIFSMVEFKKGYMYGEDLKYSSSKEGYVDDITILNKYMKDQDKSSKNIDMAEDVYVGGVANQIILPKNPNLISNIDYQSPFEIINLDYTNSFVVYSTGIGHEKLFGGILTKVSIQPDVFELMIYSENEIYKFEILSGINGFSSADNYRFLGSYPNYIGMIPIVENKLNKSRIGIVEIVKLLTDAVNKISSNSLDNIEDFVNSILVIYNMDIKEDTKENLKQYGLLGLKSVSREIPADAKYLVNSLAHADVNTKYEELLKQAYDIVGVPRASGTVTSGGDTGQARLLGGGWTRADTVAKQDEKSLVRGEREMLNIAIRICQMHPKCKVDELNVNDIEITFNRNKNDNLLTKTQALTQLYSINMPKDISLAITGLVSDVNEVSTAWETKDKEKQQTAVIETEVVEEPPEVVVEE